MGLPLAVAEHRQRLDRRATSAGAADLAGSTAAAVAAAMMSASTKASIRSLCLTSVPPLVVDVQGGRLRPMKVRIRFL